MRPEDAMCFLLDFFIFNEVWEKIMKLTWNNPAKC